MRKGHGVIVIDSMLAMKNWKRRTSSLHSYVSQYPCHLQFSFGVHVFPVFFPRHKEERDSSYLRRSRRMEHVRR